MSIEPEPDEDAPICKRVLFEVLPFCLSSMLHRKRLHANNTLESLTMKNRTGSSARRTHTAPMTDGTRRSSLSDVAALARVSAGTVSRALSRPEMVQEATRVRIVKAVRQLGYVANGAARALSSQVTHTVGAIIPRFGNSSFAGMAQALERTLSQAGFTLLIAAPDHRHSNETEILRKILERGVDAVALLGAVHEPMTYSMLASHRVPFVLMWAHAVEALPCVGFDERGAAALVIDHLAALGHRRVGFIGGRSSENERARKRYQGVVAAIARHGMTLGEGVTIETDYGFREGHDAMSRILTASPGVTAVVCGNDYLATGALAACDEAGVDVPRKLSIASFNDNEFAAYLRPPLTTVRLPIEQIGATAATYLIERLSGITPEHQIRLPIELIVRGSTAMAVDTTGVRGPRRRG